jgi:hypothetical protein
VPELRPIRVVDIAQAEAAVMGVLYGGTPLVLDVCATQARRIVAVLLALGWHRDAPAVVGQGERADGQEGGGA